MRKNARRALTRTLPAALFGALLVAQAAWTQTATPPAKYPDFPSETPAQLETASTAYFDYARREVMIPMRDGVKLHTVILVPKGAKGAPILLTRTPYDANALTTHAKQSPPGANPRRLRQRHRRYR